jgi:GTP1/Obg family GTP-binding protein
MHLLEGIKERFQVPALVVANKTDISISEIGDMSMSTLTREGVDAVLDRLVEMMPVTEVQEIQETPDIDIE